MKITIRYYHDINTIEYLINDVLKFKSINNEFGFKNTLRRIQFLLKRYNIILDKNFDTDFEKTYIV